MTIISKDMAVMLNSETYHSIYTK